MKRALIIILVLTIIIATLGCSEPAFRPENTLSPTEKEEIRNNLVTKEIKKASYGWYIGVKYKQAYANMFENRELAQHVLNGFESAFYWYKIIKNNLYEYEDGTVRVNFSKTLVYDMDDVPDFHDYSLNVFESAMNEYQSDYRFDDRKGLNAFEVYLVDLLEGTATNIGWIGYSSDSRIYLENVIQKAKEQNEQLGITTEALTESQQTEYSLCQNIDSDIQRLEDELLELASYFDIEWEEP